MGVDTGAIYGSMPTATTPTSDRKRKLADFGPGPSSTARAATFDHIPSDNAQLPSPFKRPHTANSNTSTKEKRLRRFRPEPPKSFHDLYLRATTQRFYVISRTRNTNHNPNPPSLDTNTPDDEPEETETIDLAGSTGNVYTVTIARQSRCTCPHANSAGGFGGGAVQCKHVIYVLARVLRAPYACVYQLALLRSELREIFANAPPVGTDGGTGGGGVGGGDGQGRRKPVEGDCPICFCELVEEGGGGSREQVVWCRAACGQNIHRKCFETWATTKRRQAAAGGSAGGGEVTCPYCRSVWDGDEDMVKKLKTDGRRNAEGYVNVASQLGMSTRRDYSTYSRWWSGHPRSYRRGYY